MAWLSDSSLSSNPPPPLDRRPTCVLAPNVTASRAESEYRNALSPGDTVKLLFAFESTLSAR